jgi:hypothetical protein
MPPQKGWWPRCGEALKHVAHVSILVPISTAALVA